MERNINSDVTEWVNLVPLNNCGSAQIEYSAKNDIRSIECKKLIGISELIGGSVDIVNLEIKELWVENRKSVLELKKLIDDRRSGLEISDEEINESVIAVHQWESKIRKALNALGFNDSFER